MLYLLLGGEFVAAGQVLVYGGAVMVMFLFVIAYLGDTHRRGAVGGGPSWQAVGTVLAAAAILVEVIVAIGLTTGGRSRTRRTSRAASARPASIGRLFLTDHLLAFEVTSIVLLVAAVGGVVLGSHARDAPRRSMHGPDVAWYLVLAALLFVTGALGVLLRRSPLIILLSVEIMLNGANLALIAFASRVGHEDGQVFAIAVMAIAASEVVVGLGLIVAMGDATSSSTSTS